MKKSKANMKKDAVLVASTLGGGVASAAIIKKVPSQFTGPAVLAIGIGGGLLLEGPAQAACLGMIPMGAVQTANNFLAPRVPAVSSFLPGLSGIEDSLLDYNTMGYLGNAYADDPRTYERSVFDYALNGAEEEFRSSGSYSSKLN